MKKRIALTMVAMVTVVSLMGCGITTTSTYTETHTDADGNTTTTTTIHTTDENGTTTTTETTEGVTEEEFEDAVAIFESVPITFANEMGWDVAEFKLKMSSSDEWSDNFLGDDRYLNSGETMTGINVTYDEIDNLIDISVADSTGEGVEFDGFELPTDADEIVISLEYDEVSDSYTVQLMN